MQFHFAEAFKTTVARLYEVPEEKIGFQYATQKGTKLAVLRLLNTPPLCVRLSFDDIITYERYKDVLEKVCRRTRGTEGATI